MRTSGSSPRMGSASLAWASLVALYAASAFAQDAQDEVKIEVTTPVTCTRPSQNGDTLSMHYNGTLLDGTPFDSSHERGVPFTFVLGQGRVIKGWDNGLTNMCPGEERLLTIPSLLAYGHQSIGVIPADSTLIFETQLLSIEGIEEEAVPNTTATAPAENEDIATDVIDEETDGFTTGIPDEDDHKGETDALLGDKHEAENVGIAQDAPESTSSTQGEAQPASDEGPDASVWSDNSECKLLGPFALVVQGALGLLALLSLVFKRWRERPRRPLKIWFFDASKQVFGSALLHVFNVLLSLLSSGAVELTTQGQLGAAGKSSPDANPCSFYLINIAVDTTLGIPILVLLLKVLHQAALVTPLANPPESIKSGYYGEPPKATWWLKQALIYSIGLLLMKLCVFFLFGVLPWIVWVGNWALRWTEGSEALQIAFVMFVFPLIMNGIQYYIVDMFIKDRSKEPHGHEAVPTDDRDEEVENVDRRLLEDESDDEHETSFAAGHGGDESDKHGASGATGSEITGEEERRR